MAVIGTREPTEHGVVIARNITKWFASSGWNIVSGLAKGVDTIAHKTTLRSPSKTIAVMAQGLEKVYPAENKHLATEIVTNGGLLISEYPYNASTYRNNFVQRDRIQAGLSSGVIMVQSDINGGSLHASRAILKYGRYLIVPNQSDRDINNSEPKIQANMLFSRMNKSELLNILKTNKFDISKIIIMKNKSEYTFVDDILKKYRFERRLFTEYGLWFLINQVMIIKFLPLSSLYLSVWERFLCPSSFIVSIPWLLYNRSDSERCS